MGGGTPEGTILRSMGGDMAEAIEEKTGYNLRAIIDPEAIILIKSLRRITRKMYPDVKGEGDLEGETIIHAHRTLVEKQLKECEAKIRATQYMEWQHRLHQDLSVMSLGLGNIDDAVDLDEALAPDLDGFEDVENEIEMEVTE